MSESAVPLPLRPFALHRPMPTITDNAICIRRWDYSETSQTVSLFLREHGVVRGLVKGAKRPGSAFDGGLDLLTHGQVVAIVKPNRDLATVTAWRVLEMFRVLRESLAANRAGLFMADITQLLLEEHDPHPALFDALRDALRALADPSRIGAALLRFEWTALCEAGYRPELERDAETGSELPGGPTLAFSAVAGGVVADTGAGGRWRVRRETIELLRALARDEIPQGKDPGAADRAARLLAVYLRELLGREPKTMRWAFPDLER